MMALIAIGLNGQLYASPGLCPRAVGKKLISPKGVALASFENSAAPMGLNDKPLSNPGLCPGLTWRRPLGAIILMKQILPCVLLALFCSICLLEAATEKPNIVMIIADDQTYRDFGFMGNAQVQTPNIDRLASKSARYVNGYVPTSVCSPSLATLLRATGLADRAKDLPGIDLLPSAKGLEKLDPERAVFGEIFPGDATSLRHPERDIAYRWVRQGAFKLIVPHVKGGKAWGNYLSGSALFDLNRDARETQNLIEKNATKAKHLQRLLDDWWTPAS